MNALMVGGKSSIEAAQADKIFVEDWSIQYGNPYMVAADEGNAESTLYEDGPELVFHEPPLAVLDRPIAFVDGVRRGEASLYLRRPDGSISRGVAGAHGRGAVLCHPGRRPEFERCGVSRLVIWGGGAKEPLPSHGGGWKWEAASIADPSPDAPLQDIQKRMRLAEGQLAEELCTDGYLVLLDGPLTFVQSRDKPIVGYIKTHHQARLAPEHQAQLPELRPGQRSSIFTVGADQYSCYLRLTPPGPQSGPWAGIVRIETPQSAGFADAQRVADMVTATIPRYAGIPHRDPRAPQNLQPVGALERHLRHLMGDEALAQRAIRRAVAQLSGRGNSV
jgi:hypothetical protein